MILRHWYGRRKNMIYSVNMIDKKMTYDVINDINEWWHSSIARKRIKMTKNNNQQWCQWYNTIVMGEKNMIYISLIWSLIKNNSDAISDPNAAIFLGEKNMIYSNNMINQQRTSYLISDTNDWLHSFTRRKQIKTTKNNNQIWWQWYNAIFLENKSSPWLDK